MFDAFVIYNEKDVEFATELIERCENMGHSLCVKDRDLLGGFSFESDAILKLLANRVNRVIIIVSKAFLKSPMQVFTSTFAQSIGIEKNQRKIIPILLEMCDLPQMLRFCYRFDYYKNSKIFNFWDRLDKTIKTAKVITTVQQRSDRYEIIRYYNFSLFFNKQFLRTSIYEIDASSSNLKVVMPTTPVSLYDKEQNYKFTETPTPTLSEKSKRSSKIFSFKKSSPQETKQIWPPSPKLRAASSMLNLDSSLINPPPLINNLSQSSFYINDVGLEMSKSKRNKWYNMFLPPSSKKYPREKVMNEQPEVKEQEKDKKKWYKIKKKNPKELAFA